MWKKYRKIRQSQVISPFGIGQIVNFPNDESLMICGLDLWDEALEQRKKQAGPDKIQEDAFKIIEPRLAQMLNVDHFRYPFPYAESGNKNTNLELPAIRFPFWHYCTCCGRMTKVEMDRPSSPDCNNDGCKRCNPKKDKGKSEPIQCKGRLIPVRFVAACPHGHIQDFPFKKWVHEGEPDSKNGPHLLTYKTGQGTSDLGNTFIHCSCGKNRSLSGIIGDKALSSLTKCSGNKPWLGKSGLDTGCDQDLRVLLRGSSNIYYAKIKSALKLPILQDDTPKAVKRVWEDKTIVDFCKDSMDEPKMIKRLLKGHDVVKSGSIDLEELYKHFIGLLEKEGKKQDKEEINDTIIRFAEYKLLIKSRDAENDDFKSRILNLDPTDGSLVSQYFDCVGLVEKLQETRVFTGFTRIDSENEKTQREKIQDLSNRTNIKWLPANIVYGEGIFIQFKDQLIDEWLENHSSEGEKILNKYWAFQQEKRPHLPQRNLNAAFLLIHTFAHLLINRLIYNCGYGSSSLRERIYFNTEADYRMNGVLIYTSSGDSEGSMGGLVRQGQADSLERLVREVLEEARWCSADPVCMEIGKNEGQGPESLNGAACHNCAIVPETSCEEFNTLLDRSLLIDETYGFFNRQKTQN